MMQSIWKACLMRSFTEWRMLGYKALRFQIFKGIFRARVAKDEVLINVIKYLRIIIILFNYNMFI
jgi:hypothetical protein